MDEVKTVDAQTEKSIPVFKILYKNLIFIILLTVLCTLIGWGYSLAKVSPTYTATRSLILRTEIQGGGSEGSQVSNQATLAKRYFNTVEKLIKSPKLIQEANDRYTNESSKIVSGAVNMIYGEKSLIFKVSYTDMSEDLAVEKLETLIETFSNSDIIREGVMADSVEFLHTQKACEISKNTEYAKFILMGAAIGLVVSVAISVLVYVLDNTVKDKKEFEELTGVNVIAYIAKDKPQTKKNKA